ncbi:hypothetical protein A5647_07330 [Mycobacterium sp. 1100029.7]|nr:hypothetical protein A5647_07330 [Mycobacterium sp. 1100029.7]
MYRASGRKALLTMSFWIMGVSTLVGLTQLTRTLCGASSLAKPAPTTMTSKRGPFTCGDGMGASVALGRPSRSPDASVDEFASAHRDYLGDRRALR